MAPKGMLSELFSPTYKSIRDEEQDQEKIHQFQATDPVRANAHAMYGAGTLAGQGIGRAAVALGGGDPRTSTERNVQAIEAAKQQVAQSGVDPNDTDAFYRAVMMALQQQGLVAEAAAIAKEWRAEKVAGEKTGLENEKLKLERDKLLAQQARDERNYSLGIRKIESAEVLAKAKNATAKEIAEAKLTAEELKQGPFKTINFGDHIKVINRHNEVVREGPIGLNPKAAAAANDKLEDAKAAYAEAMAGVQRHYDAAVQLHNSKGVPGMTGRWGYWVGQMDKGLISLLPTWLSSDDARASLALYDQVSGGAFLAGLAKLKAASKTGATGLGAVSEKEGDKVQADAAAINRLQAEQSFRNQLAQYVRWVEGFADRLADAAQGDQIAPISLQKKPLTAPRRGGRAAPAAAPAAPAQSAPTVPAPLPKGEATVRVMSPNGRSGTIPRSKLEDAKRRGYTEIK